MTEEELKEQERLEAEYITLMRRLGTLWERSKRTTNTATGGECFDVHLCFQVTNAAEMVPLRYRPDPRGIKTVSDIEVLMTRRSPIVGPGNPPEYAGRLHSPGCMVMWNMSVREALDRVVEKETGVPYRIIGAIAPDPDAPRSPRGWEISLAYLVKLEGEPRLAEGASWIPLCDLERLYREGEVVVAQYEGFLSRVVDWVSNNRAAVISG